MYNYNNILNRIARIEARSYTLGSRTKFLFFDIDCKQEGN